MGSIHATSQVINKGELSYISFCQPQTSTPDYSYRYLVKKSYQINTILPKILVQMSFWQTKALSVSHRTSSHSSSGLEFSHNH